MLEIFIIVVGIGLDRLTKIFAINDLQALPGGDYSLWPGVFHFTYIENSGASFGILQNSQVFFIVIGSAVVGIIGYLLIKKRNYFPLWVRCTMAVVLAGAIGNLIDRVLFGYVVDFLYFKLIDFAIFNVADCFLVVGTIIFAVYLLFVYKEPIKAEKKCVMGKDIFQFNSHENFNRLDVCVSKLMDVSRSHAQTLIKDGLVRVNEKSGKPSMKVSVGDNIEVSQPEVQVLSTKPENIDIDIIYQDKDLAVINKSKGMVVHPAVGNASGTLVNALLYHIKDLSGINLVIRPGIVHRLDKDTSGLLVIAKNDNAHIYLAKQIKDRTATRIYSALVLGNIKEDEGEVIAPIGRHPKDRKKMAVVEGGRDAYTNFTVVERYGDATLLKLKLITGRTHQIRVHMAYIGHGVLGDETYGPSKPVVPIKGQALHAGQLSFDHPTTLERMQFSVDPPKDFLHLQQWFVKRKGLR